MPQLTVGGKVDEHVGLAATLEAGRLFTPFSRYRITEEQAIGQMAPGSAAQLYAPHTSGVAGSWRFRTTGVMTADAGLVRAAVGGSVSHQTTNVGFSNSAQRASKRGPLVLMPVAQFGMGLGAVDIAMQGWWALGATGPTDGVYKGPGARLVAEVHLGKPSEAQ